MFILDIFFLIRFKVTIIFYSQSVLAFSKQTIQSRQNLVSSCIPLDEVVDHNRLAVNKKNMLIIDSIITGLSFKS